MEFTLGDHFLMEAEIAFMIAAKIPAAVESMPPQWHGDVLWATGLNMATPALQALEDTAFSVCLTFSAFHSIILGPLAGAFMFVAS